MRRDPLPGVADTSNVEDGCPSSTLYKGQVLVRSAGLAAIIKPDRLQPSEGMQVDDGLQHRIRLGQNRILKHRLIGHKRIH